MSKLAEQILRIVSGGDPAIESKIELAELEFQIELAGNVVGRQTYFENRQAEGQGEVNGCWVIEYPITLSAGRFPSEKFATLPAVYLDLPQDRGVVDAFYIREGRPYSIVYVPNNQFGSNSPSVQALGKYIYTVQNGRLTVSTTCYEEANRLTTIYAKLAVANETTIDQAKGLMVIERVLPWALRQAGIQTDMVTDSNPNQKR